MSFQIDVSPDKEHDFVFKIELYINGRCYKLMASKEIIEDLKNDGLINQTIGMRHNEKNELVRFEYPDGVDGAGVKYTSEVYELHKKPQP